MRKLLVIPFILVLGACSNTLHGIVDDTADNLNKGIDWTGEVAVKSFNVMTNAVGNTAENVSDVDVNLPDVPDVKLPKGKGKGSKI